jgi:hypothetical protein
MCGVSPVLVPALLRVTLINYVAVVLLLSTLHYCY